MDLEKLQTWLQSSQDYFFFSSCSNFSDTCIFFIPCPLFFSFKIGMGKEVENLIMENNELLATKYDILLHNVSSLNLLTMVKDSF